MALIATQTLTVGSITFAVPGSIVSKEAVQMYGWQDQVEDDGYGADDSPTPPPADDAADETF